jgi:hypothetical protein
MGQRHFVSLWREKYTDIEAPIGMPWVTASVASFKFFFGGFNPKIAWQGGRNVERDERFAGGQVV